MLKSYNENGFFIKKNFISQKKIINIIINFNNIICESLKMNNIDIYKEFNSDVNNYDSIVNIFHENLKKLFNFDKEIYINVVKSIRRTYDIYSLFINDDIKILLKELQINNPSIPTETVLNMDSNSLIINPEYVILPAHQDFTANPSSLDSIVIWIPLTNITNDSFPLQIIRNTHKNGIFEGTLTKNFYEVNNNEIEKLDNKLEDVIMNVGDILIFSQFLIHKTKYTKNYDGLRIAVSYRFDNHDEETFIKRDYPNAYNRVVNRQEPNLGFPSSEYLSNKIFK